jgi:carboxyl-terminal processing protease
LSLFLLVAGAALAAVDSAQPLQPEPGPGLEPDQSLRLEPGMDQRYASNIATRFLTNYHYKRTRLDDELSGQIFDSYLELLDPNRIYFLASDIEMFERYRHGMDDALRHSDLLSAYEIFNIYVERVQQRVDYAQRQGAVRFHRRRVLPVRPRRQPWAVDTAGLDELWRLRVKNDYLRLLLTDKEPEAIVETLVERYDNLERRIQELNNEDVFQFS